MKPTTEEKPEPGSLHRMVRRLAEPRIPVWYLAAILVGSMLLAAILTWLDWLFKR